MNYFREVVKSELFLSIYDKGTQPVNYSSLGEMNQRRQVITGIKKKSQTNDEIIEIASSGSNLSYHEIRHHISNNLYQGMESLIVTSLNKLQKIVNCLASCHVKEIPIQQLVSIYHIWSNIVSYLNQLIHFFKIYGIEISSNLYLNNIPVPFFVYFVLNKLATLTNQVTRNHYAAYSEIHHIPLTPEYNQLIVHSMIMAEKYIPRKKDLPKMTYNLFEHLCYYHHMISGKDDVDQENLFFLVKVIKKYLNPENQIIYLKYLQSRILDPKITDLQLRKESLSMARRIPPVKSLIQNVINSREYHTRSVSGISIHPIMMDRENWLILNDHKINPMYPLPIKESLDEISRKLDNQIDWQPTMGTAIIGAKIGSTQVRIRCTILQAIVLLTLNRTDVFTELELVKSTKIPKKLLSIILGSIIESGIVTYHPMGRDYFCINHANYTGDQKIDMVKIFSSFV